MIEIERFSCPGLFGREMRCRIRVFASVGRHVVIATEVTDNPGASVTNVAEKLATRVCQHYGIQPADLVWIEHYTRSDGADPRFDLVTFKLDRVSAEWPDDWQFITPKWRAMTDDDWSELGISEQRRARL